MELFIQIAQLVLSLSILIILHEFGHFLPARWFGIKVEKFFLFFDVKFALFKKKIGETVYGIGWLPLGGYVKIAGMIDESMDKEQMKQPAQEWEFRSKPAWQRLIVMVGGVTVNVLLAWFIYTAMLVYYGDSYIPADRLKYGIEVGDVGEELGFKNGDQILAVDGRKMVRFDQAQIEVLLGDQVTVLRNNQELTIDISDRGKKAVLDSEERFINPAPGNTISSTIKENSVAQKIGLEGGDKIIGINNQKIEKWSDFQEKLAAVKGSNFTLTIDRDGSILNKETYLAKEEPLGVFSSNKGLVVTDEYGVLAAIPVGWNKTVDVLLKQIKQFKLIFNKTVKGYTKVKGPIGIVDLMEPQWNWFAFWGFTAMFSVWLAFVNILPIPALDGGHVMFLLYEMISGKAPSEKTLERGQIIGFVIVMGIMVLVFGNDIWNLIKGYF